MCNAERDTVEGNVRFTFNKKLQRAQVEYDALLELLNEKREECAFMHGEVEKMEGVFLQHSQKEKEHKKIVEGLHAQIANRDKELDRCIASRQQVIQGERDNPIFLASSDDCGACIFTCIFTCIVQEWKKKISLSWSWKKNT